MTDSLNDFASNREVQPQDNPVLQDNFAPVGIENSFEQLEVVGTIPEDLQGTLLRAGPNPMDPGPNHHWFLGDGMLHGIQLRNGKAMSYRNRWVRTKALEEKTGMPAPKGWGPMINYQSFKITTVLVLLTSGVVTSAFAASDGSPVIEEIVVTAEARAENIQDVPVAVTAFSETDIADAGIESTADFIALTPNVSFDDSFTVGNSFVAIRGVTQINNADSPVAIVVDGVPQNNQKQFKMDLYDTSNALRF